ncbi:hypothetical protein BJ875DRAFT_441195 [Amylocarpus encephaloides]|uniref:Uncharacterized protein n=1 Tax=Amylocarpus encephaloides TaxID=45428 RepID=A0A9P7YK31_9HELO|nr:hypothetical protein BJ875DRAFT_441195 [Amylocarpus encephaloides]
MQRGVMKKMKEEEFVIRHRGSSAPGVASWRRRKVVTHMGGWTSAEKWIGVDRSGSGWIVVAYLCLAGTYSTVRYGYSCGVRTVHGHGWSHGPWTNMVRFPPKRGLVLTIRPVDEHRESWYSLLSTRPQGQLLRKSKSGVGSWRPKGNSPQAFALKRPFSRKDINGQARRPCRGVPLQSSHTMKPISTIVDEGTLFHQEGSKPGVLSASGVEVGGGIMELDVKAK